MDKSGGRIATGDLVFGTRAKASADRKIEFS
jgi:hypothetical protein